MTALATAKRRKRYETSTHYRRGLPVMVELHPFVMTLRLKGRRIAFDVPYDAIYDLGGRLAERARRAEKEKR